MFYPEETCNRFMVSVMVFNQVCALHIFEKLKNLRRRSSDPNTPPGLLRAVYSGLGTVWLGNIISPEGGVWCIKAARKPNLFPKKSQISTSECTSKTSRSPISRVPPSL
ncbi:hypothetical protein ZHAS_00020053 [Anopheles sinensis]|uniref:Uncharacterized protein n=1 Tax=Anopheles sinensis TaxID=74873 RepID=A0A084WNU9_ANOSI|nr:hypothetical protein ZHAS_00020053 [Anopheles sinensis]